MQARADSSHILRRGAMVCAFLFAATWAAWGDSVGGGFWPSVGPGRIALRGSGLKPIEVTGNFRFVFNGRPSDLSGTATVLAYDSVGQQLLGQFPCAWTGKKSGSFQVDLDNEPFADFLEARIEAATGKSASVTLAAAKARGTPARSRQDLRVSLRGTGEATLDDGPPVRLQVTMRLK